MKNGNWTLNFNHDTNEAREGTVTAVWTETPADPAPAGFKPLTFVYSQRTAIDGQQAQAFIQGASAGLAAFLEKVEMHQGFIDAMQNQLNQPTA